MKPTVNFEWIKGQTYQEVWDLQTGIHSDLVQNKLLLRNQPESVQKHFSQNHQLLFCEHKPVFTLGKSGSMDHLLLSEKELHNEEIEFFKINRGGDITYHGPGQITGYPIFDLDEFFTDVHKFVRLIEEAIIRTMEVYGLQGIRMPGYTGVWLGPDISSNKYRKICAIGVHLSRWVSMHGFAFNVNTDLSYFEKIIPCGIAEDNKTVTSLSRELKKKVDIEEAGNILADKLAELFGFELIFK